MRIIYFFHIIFLLFFSLESCDIINPDETIPATITIDSFIVSSDILTQGSNSSKITDVWINIDGNLQGIYELPATFPVLETGDRALIIRAGIKNNGIAASREIYEFYNWEEMDITLTSGENKHITPQISYKDNLNFMLIEDFEDPGLKFVTTEKSDTDLIHSNIDVFEGYRSGMIVLDSNHTFFECKSYDSLFLPVNMTKVYVEMDYKSDLDLNYVGNNQFAVGIFATTSTSVIQDPVIYLNETGGKWNKIYIDLTDFLNEYQTALYFHLFIGANKEKSFPDAQISIDNIKVITYQDE